VKNFHAARHILNLKISKAQKLGVPYCLPGSKVSVQEANKSTIQAQFYAKMEFIANQLFEVNMLGT